jgi:hypothetical protein
MNSNRFCYYRWTWWWTWRERWGAKVGVDDGSNANVGVVKSEVVFLDHNGVPFVAVWQNSLGASGAEIDRDCPIIYKVIDEVVKKWP